jgi:hypothetical protein
MVLTTNRGAVTSKTQTPIPAADFAEPRDLRYRRKLFPDAERLVFDTNRRGFVPLPILLRKLMRHLNAPEFRILVYLHLRASRYGICFPTLDEMAFEIGLSGRKNIIPHLKSLEQKHAISTRTAMGKKFYLVHDPRVPLQYLIDSGQISDEEIEEIGGLCYDLRQEPLVRSHTRGGKGSRDKAARTEGAVL